MDWKYIQYHSNLLQFKISNYQPEKLFTILDDINCNEVNNQTFKPILNTNSTNY